MTSEVSTQLAFDYGKIPSADSKALEKHAEKILTITEQQRRRTVENALKIGEELAAAQERLSNHGNGTFGKWCVERLGMSSRSAQRLILIHDQLPKKDCDTVSRLFDLGALHHLLADTTPEEAYTDAMKAAKKGETITQKRAKEIIGEYVIDEDEFDSATALTNLLEYIKRQFSAWPKPERKYLLNQLNQLTEELETPESEDDE